MRQFVEIYLINRAYLKITHGDAGKITAYFPFTTVEQILEYVETIKDIIGAEESIQ